MKCWVLKNNKKGFTLIELLVVIAVIGLLASIVLVSVNSARAKARDTKRKADLYQLQQALEMYYDENGIYPSERHCDSSAGNCDSHCNECVLGDSWDDGSISFISAALIPDFISNLPIDPINSVGDGYIYIYEPAQSRSNYCLSIKLEAGGYFDIKSGEGPWDCRRY